MFLKCLCWTNPCLDLVNKVKRNLENAFLFWHYLDITIIALYSKQPVLRFKAHQWPTGPRKELSSHSLRQQTSPLSLGNGMLKGNMISGWQTHWLTITKVLPLLHWRAWWCFTAPLVLQEWSPIYSVHTCLKFRQSINMYVNLTV